MKEEKNHDTIIRIIALAVLLSLVGLALFALFIPPAKVEYTYEVKISPPTGVNDTYSVLVPVPLDNEGNVSGIIKELKIVSGICTYRLNQTEYGPALEITGKGDIHLRIAGTKKQSGYPRLSMYVDNDWDMGYRVWHNLKGKHLNITVDLHYISLPSGHIGMGSVSIDEHGNGEVTDGWGLIDGSSKVIMAD